MLPACTPMRLSAQTEASLTLSKGAVKVRDGRAVHLLADCRAAADAHRVRDSVSQPESRAVAAMTLQSMECFMLPPASLATLPAPWGKAND